MLLIGDGNLNILLKEIIVKKHKISERSSIKQSHTPKTSCSIFSEISLSKK